MSRTRRALLQTLPALALGAALGPAARAQEAWPSRPITMVVPFAAGNVTDSIARLIADRLGRARGQSVVVENKPG
ncbi:MAG TPA: tripartite tricarboxylate transporter substrate binding protein, partial [Ramlibacter sp.]|nr:tripartite tricarboxylate transporter substrate binding protein [Ramlibacter sp.]